MNYKLILLRALLNIDVWKKYRHLIKPDKNREQELLYNILDDLIESHQRSISPEEYIASINSALDTFKFKDKEIFEQALNIIFDANVQDDIIQDILKSIRKQELAEKLGMVSFEYLEGTKKLEDISNIYDQLTEDVEIKGLQFATDDLEELYQHNLKEPGLRWRLQCLNRMLGSLRKGDFGFVFARPETGKTTFLASEVTYFAEQAKSPILWFNNEEGIWKVTYRCFESSLGMPMDELNKDRENAQRQYRERTKGNIKFIDSASLHRREIEHYCDQYAPSLVVIDQIDKLTGFTADREDLMLGRVYQWARELAKKHCPVIGICQADGSGDGVKWLNMGHVANAKTSKQAEADFIIGIGKTFAEDEEFLRYINISKNKLTGDPDTDPNRRHGKAVVRIRPDIARYEDLPN